jgi:hypothetical protein
VARYQRPPPPSAWKRAVAWAHTTLGATIVGGLIVGLIVAAIVFYVFEHGGENSSSVSVTTAKPTPKPPPEPKSATEQAAQRAIWTSPPTTFRNADVGAEGAAATDPVRTDLLVGFPREIFEEPESFEGKTFFVVGRVVSHQPVTGPFYDRELRLVTGESGFDAYVGAASYETLVVTGEVVTALGRLAATGETRPPGGSPHRSIYLLSVREENGGEVEGQILTPSSGNIRRAIKRVKASTK